MFYCLGGPRLWIKEKVVYINNFADNALWIALLCHHRHLGTSKNSTNQIFNEVHKCVDLGYITMILECVGERVFIRRENIKNIFNLMAEWKQSKDEANVEESEKQAFAENQILDTWLELLVLYHWITMSRHLPSSKNSQYYAIAHGLWCIQGFIKDFIPGVI